MLELDSMTRFVGEKDEYVALAMRNIEPYSSAEFRGGLIAGWTRACHARLAGG